MTTRPANGNDNPNNQPNARGWFCPSCGGADVTASALAGGEANCNICNWKGKVEELATFHFSHDGGTPEEVLQRFLMDVRKFMSEQQFATALGSLLIKWGFLLAPDAKTKAIVTQHLARYVGEAAKAIVQSVLNTRRDLEKETHGNSG